MRISLFASVAISALLATGGYAFAQDTTKHSDTQLNQGSSTSEMHKATGQQHMQSGRNAAEGAANDQGSSQIDQNHAKSTNRLGASSSSSSENSATRANSGANGSLATDQSKSPQRMNSRSSAAERANRKSSTAARSSETGPQNRANAASRNGATANSAQVANSPEMGRNQANRGQMENRSAQAGRLSDPQQKRVFDRVRSEHVQNITGADFSVRVGGVVPAHYRFHPLPTEIVSIYPQYRDDEFLMVNDEIVIVQPRTHRIVRTISEYRTAAMNSPANDCQ